MTATTDDHDCIGYLDVEVSSVDTASGLSMISATPAGSDGLTVFMRCRKCGQCFDAEYLLEDIEPRG